MRSDSLKDWKDWHILHRTWYQYTFTSHLYRIKAQYPSDELHSTVYEYTVKLAHAVTSVKQSPVLKSPLFRDLSYTISCEL